MKRAAPDARGQSQRREEIEHEETLHGKENHWFFGEAEANVLIKEIQKNACRTVLLTIEGLGILAVEAAINAALVVVKDAVNTALGFALL